MNPQIEFKHVLGELSVNRNDPCEVIRELISNAYDAGAKRLFYTPLEENSGFIFADDGTGLDFRNAVNGITPWEAFFSIGKSTKKKGAGIGYKCQGSKLCFACRRILVATRVDAGVEEWYFKIIDNPRNNLDVNSNIEPQSGALLSELEGLYQPRTAEAETAIDNIKSFLLAETFKTGTVIAIDGLETEDFRKYFSIGANIDQSYIYNYTRFFTCHGDVRYLIKEQGFAANQVRQVTSRQEPRALSMFSAGKEKRIPFGYPYLSTDDSDISIKSPAQISRLRDGRFFSRGAKTFALGSYKYSVILAVDGNRRSLDEYKHLDRKGKAISGIRLSDQRGIFISVKGIKICKYLDLLASIPEYQVLTEGDAQNHFIMIIDGDFDLVTNRNSLSKKAFDTLLDQSFLREIKKFLDEQKRNDKIFTELLTRLRQESTQNRLNDQIANFEGARDELKTRERFRITDKDGVSHLFLSPKVGEEYLVGVLYSTLYHLVPADSPYKKYWLKIATFSTQGIDSLALKDPTSSQPLGKNNIASLEYKYEFSNNGPFNHALTVVDYIVSWEVNFNMSKNIRDEYTCFGDIRELVSGFEWEIHAIENDEGGQFDQVVKVLSLKHLIRATFPRVKFTKGSD